MLQPKNKIGRGGVDQTIWQEGKPLTSGYIALQSEGQPIDFRRVELKNLKREK